VGTTPWAAARSVIETVVPSSSEVRMAMSPSCTRAISRAE
jgi:hypothetical protein